MGQGHVCAEICANAQLLSSLHPYSHCFLEKAGRGPTAEIEKHLRFYSVETKASQRERDDAPNLGSQLPLCSALRWI